MRVFLVNLPWNENGRRGVRAGSRWPFTSLPEKTGRIRYIPFPFFLAYATALLKREGQEAKLIDAIAEGTGEQEIIDLLSIYSPGILAVETSTPSFKNDIKLLGNIKNRLPGCLIAVCGPHASTFPKQILSEYSLINYVLIGEYEYTLLELVRHLEGNLNLEDILGLAYRDGSKVRVNKLRSPIEDLNVLPWPERASLPIYKYNDGFCGLPQPNVQMWSSRGCPFQCIFCLWPQAMYREHRYRMRDPIDVVDEMEWLVNSFGFKAVYFDDDVFNIDKGHILNVCKEIVRRGITIPWAVMARADLMDRKILEAMRAAGVYAIKYGLESANQKVLESCKKDMNLEKAKEAILITKELGIKVHLTVCMGLPGESKDSRAETAEFIADVNPDSLQSSFAVPFPGTTFFDYAKDNGWLLSEDWSDYDGNRNSFSRKYS